MKTTLISAAALAAVLAFSGGAFAQVPSGGADAKGNAPLKHAHTVNDGGAKKGATSFTQGEARKHIEHAGYTDVSPLTKGKDGVWRGTASKDGTAMKIGLDFKGNVVDAGPAVMTAATGETHAATVKPTTTDMASSAMTTSTTTTPPVHHAMRHRHHHHHRVRASCANPTPNGAACSGIDRNKNGISDKEDRAIKAGAKP